MPSHYVATFFTGLVCGLCGKWHSKDLLQTVCQDCGRPLLAQYDLSAASAALNKEKLPGREASLWRYREMLPLPLDTDPITLGEGWTPLLPAPLFGEKIGLPHLWINEIVLSLTGTQNSKKRYKKYLLSMNQRFPMRLAAGLSVAILIDTVLQLVWKYAVLSLPSDGSPWLNLRAILHSPLFIFVLLLMAFQFFNWLMVLGNADLSYAQPITALSYVSVFCLSVFYLKEAADPIQIAGIVLVLIGVWFISQTDHVTVSKEREA